MTLTEKMPVVKWNVTWRKNAQGQFLHPAKTQGNSPYFVGDMVLSGVHSLSGGQTRKVVATVFTGSLLGDAIQAELNKQYKEGETALINRETGVQSIPVEGNFYDFYIGIHDKTWTNEVTGETRTDRISVESQFVFGGDSPEKEHQRVLNRVEKNPNYARVEADALDAKLQDQLTESTIGQ